MPFSALIEGGGGEWDRFWTPMHKGGRVAALKMMRFNSRVIQCSLYRGGRFVGTVKREETT